MMRPLLLRACLAFTLTLAGVSNASAHEDTLIQLKGTQLVDLPEHHTPAELDLNAFRLRIGLREMVLAPALKKLFEQPYDLRISASWYHRGVAPKLPPYLLLDVQPKKKDFSYKILFNLNNLDVINLGMDLRVSPSSTWSMTMPISKQDDAEIRKSVRTLK